MHHNAIVFLLGMTLGGILEILFTFVFELITKRPLRINHKFSLGKKLSLISLPIWGLVALLAVSNANQAKLFFYSALVGTTLEFCLGKFLKKTFGVKIWTYKHGALGEYTSIYSLPYWGAAGMVFIALAHTIGM